MATSTLNTTSGDQSNTIPNSTSTKPDYSSYEQALRKKVASTKQVSAPDTNALSGATSNLTGQYKAVGDAALANYQNQQQSTQKQAESAASALNIAGQSTIDYAKQLDTLKSSVAQQVQSASESWDRASAKADEFVQKANTRVKEVLNKLDSIHQEFQQERSFAKAHDMQVAAQSVIGSMKAEERNIMEVYGAESPEYAQFKQQKINTLATTQSNIQASYAKLAEEQNTTYMSTVADAYTKSNMYLGYQEQQQVEMLKWADQAKASYELQASELQVGLEQAKMNGMENLANWVLETPTFTMDATPLISLIADLGQTQETMAQANELNQSQQALNTSQLEREKMINSRMKRVLG